MPGTWDSPGEAIHMKRRLFTILSALSLLLFVAVCVLWLRSYFRADSYYSGGDDGTLLYVESGRGFVSVMRTSMDPQFTSKETKWASSELPSYPMWGRPSTLAQRLGFWSMTAQGYHGLSCRWIVPCWFLSVLTCVLPGGWLIGHGRRRQRQRRIAAGLCVRCGYDLRSTPDRCPECGHVASPPPP